jgi:hypothetical protein
VSALVTVRLVSDGDAIAIRIAGIWCDPYGGVFSAREIADMDRFVAGEIDAFDFGAQSVKVEIAVAPKVETDELRAAAKRAWADALRTDEPQARFVRAVALDAGDASGFSQIANASRGQLAGYLALLGAEVSK